jgi:hypothetical protein
MTDEEYQESLNSRITSLDNTGFVGILIESTIPSDIKKAVIKNGVTARKGELPIPNIPYKKDCNNSHISEYNTLRKPLNVLSLSDLLYGDDNEYDLKPIDFNEINKMNTDVIHNLNNYPNHKCAFSNTDIDDSVIFKVIDFS